MAGFDGYSSSNPFDRQIGVKSAVLSDLREKQNVLYVMLRSLYDSSFQPAISGYNLIFLTPPDFSSPSSAILTPFESEELYLDKVPLLATDFTPPDIQVGSVNVNLSTSATMTLPTGLSNGGVLNINYLDNNNLKLYAFHEYWVKYIGDITAGRIAPAEEYYKKPGENDNVCEIDYVGAAIIAKFDPTMSKLLHIGKAVGIYPVSQPVKEILGTRGSYELINVPVSYNCMAYLAATNDDLNRKLFEQLQEEFFSKVNK
jgi:hypothetical protein